MAKEIKFKAVVSETIPNSVWLHDDIDRIDLEDGKIYVGKNFMFDLDKTILYINDEEVRICQRTK